MINLDNTESITCVIIIAYLEKIMTGKRNVMDQQILTARWNQHSVALPMSWSPAAVPFIEAFLCQKHLSHVKRKRFAIGL